MDEFNQVEKVEKVEIQQEVLPGNDQYDSLKTSSFYNESYKKPTKGRLRGMIVPLLIVALLSSLLTGGIFASYFALNPPQQSNNSDGAPNSNTPKGTLTDSGIKQIEIISKTNSPAEAVAEKVGPSIVGINVDFQYNDMFFGSQAAGGQASGIIFNSEGYILTNNHVIESAMEPNSKNKIAEGSKISVILPNQEDKPYTATVVGRDEKTDIAVLKINASELPTVEFANSDDIKVGQYAIAIGNPAGLEFMGSTSMGVISGLNRTLEFDDGRTMKLIQTDAAINQGNSGGALLNTEGKVIGVNSAKIGGDGFESLGFAIPSNVAKEVADSLISNGYVKGRPQLGITVDTRFTKEIADKNGVPMGILVSDVLPLSGAFRAGIKDGDIITKFNKVSVTSFDELEEQKNKFKAGDSVEIELYRIPASGEAKDGSYKTVTVTLSEDTGN